MEKGVFGRATIYMMKKAEKDRELNEKQDEAASYFKGPLLIVAGAGAGKTKTITHRIARMIDSGIPGDSILAVTFTNKAAKEMRERVEIILKKTPQGVRALSESNPTIATFHSFCVRVLRAHAHALGLPRNFTIWDKDDGTKCVKDILKQLGIEKDAYEPRAILSRISKEKGRARTLDMFQPHSHFEETVAVVWRMYAEALAKEHALDFDDLLVRTLIMLREHESILQQLRTQFRFIIVDEYQDTNLVQFELVKLLAGEEKNICVVGDVDQNIYSWRGASIAHLLEFERVFPGTKVVVLEQNYRSTKTILAAADDIIKKNTHRHEKTVFTENEDGEPIVVYGAYSEKDEARYVAEEAARLIRGRVPAEQIAVLYRANFQSRALEQAFFGAGIPYRVLGTKFFERKEVKDALSYIRAALNPESRVDLARIIGTPPRGIGKGTFARVLEKETGMLPAAAQKKVSAFFELLAHMKKKVETQKTSEALRSILDMSGLIAHFNNARSEEDAERAGNLRELVSLSTAYDALPAPEGMEKLLEDAALFGEQDSLDEKERAVSLMTIHAAKGLEFDTVFVTGLEEELFPMERSDEDTDEEEERRLCYVAITRAKRNLFLTWAQTRLVYGTRSITVASRFLSDIDASHLSVAEPSLLEAWGSEYSISL